jgi:hypothetical protein
VESAFCVLVPGFRIVIHTLVHKLPCYLIIVSDHEMSGPPSVIVPFLAYLVDQ